MRLSTVLAVSALALAAAAQPAAAAVQLIHAYEFSNTGGAQVVDLAGSANGTLYGDASISGGQLRLDGDGDYVEFADALVPASGADFSVLLRVRIDATQASIAEIISQGFSGSHGFYIGTNGGSGFRLTDAAGAPGVGLPSADTLHNLLLTNGADGLRFYIDDGDTAVFTAAKVTDFNVGTPTRFGRQFGGYGEFFHGELDTVRIFDGVVSLDEALRSPGSTAPEPAAWAMMILGFFGAGHLLRRRGPGGARRRVQSA